MLCGLTKPVPLIIKSCIRQAESRRKESLRASKSRMAKYEKLKEQLLRDSGKGMPIKHEDAGVNLSDAVDQGT